MEDRLEKLQFLKDNTKEAIVYLKTIIVGMEEAESRGVDSKTGIDSINTQIFQLQEELSSCDEKVSCVYYTLDELRRRILVIKTDEVTSVVEFSYDKFVEILDIIDEEKKELDEIVVTIDKWNNIRGLGIDNISVVVAKTDIEKSVLAAFNALDQIIIDLKKVSDRVRNPSEDNINTGSLSAFNSAHINE